jgi:hypothetical protein
MRLNVRVLVPVVLVLALMVFPGVPGGIETASAAPGTDAFAYFPETGHNISFEIKEFFDAHGGVDIFGLPLTEVIVEESTGRQVQYFERARFELHPELTPENYVTLTLVGSVLAQHRTEPAFTWLTASPDPERDFFPESGHTLGGAFRYFWQTRGGVNVFGYPISEEFYEVNPADGQEYLVQYFQRARFEYHPEAAGTPYEVQLGNLGRQYLEQVHPSALAHTAPVREISLLGESTTSFAASIREREHNIARATAMFDRTIVPANTEFSFNNAHEYTVENGFVEGYAIVGGRLEKVVAGGLCQVSTTMFRAVSNAGLEIVERQGHSSIVDFYENILGFDATVYEPILDFKWYNDTPGPVYIITDSNVQDATVTFSIWGYSDGRVVTYEGPYTSAWVQPGPAIWEYDPTLPWGAVVHMIHGRAGTDVRYIRHITLPNGMIKTNAYETHYEPWADFYIYGPGAR